MSNGIAELIEVLEFNSHHDARGRFASGGGKGNVTTGAISKNALAISKLGIGAKRDAYTASVNKLDGVRKERNAKISALKKLQAQKGQNHPDTLKAFRSAKRADNQYQSLKRDAQFAYKAYNSAMKSAQGIVANPK